MKTIRRLTALALLVGAAAPASAQAGREDPRFPASAIPGVLVFADTASARVEVRLRGRAELAGTPLRGRIVDAASGAEVWSGPLGALARAGSDARLSARITRLQRKPRLWSPGAPNLHHLVVSGGAVADTVRFGFRRFETKDGQLYLNGRRIFLRGNAINPPERNLPDSLSDDPRFARDYIRYLKSVNVNIIRLTRPSQPWFDVADEEGMMIFQGHYGTPFGGTSTSPPADTAAAIAWYTDNVLSPQVNHPSIVIYTISNEQSSPEISYLSRNHAAVTGFLTLLHDTLSRFDDTRLYIGNAGYGFGRAGEICDLHRYWGWYYNTALSFYTLRDPKLCWRSDRKQPITLTENTGNYTGPDGRFNLVSATKQPDSQLNWTGHAPDEEQGPRALAYQAWVAKQAIETTRRLRSVNPHLAGLSPFSIIFHDWWGIRGFADMRPKPIARQYAISYQPVLLSWELWTPQVYVGATLRPTAYVVNDSERGEDLRGLRLRYEVVRRADGTRVTGGERAIADVPYFASRPTPVAIPLPGALATGEYVLRGALVRGADTLSRNSTDLFIAGREYSDNGARLAAPARRLRLFDEGGKTAAALAKLALESSTVTAEGIATLDPARDALVIGAGAWGAPLSAQAAAIRQFVRRGGRVLLLAQDPATFDGSWLPAPIRMSAQPVDHPLLYPEGRPYRNGMAVNPERPDHPVLAGIDRDRLFLWSDWTGWTPARPEFPEIYPVVNGFTFADPDDLARANILASYDHGLQGIGMAEIFDGSGAIVVSGFGLVERAGLDPVADRMLKNLVRYTTSARPVEPHPLIDSPIRWGDYASERGVVPEIHSGFLVHTAPRVPETLRAAFPDVYRWSMDENGFQYAGPRGAWNTHPSVQYVAGAGRRPYGPYRFTLGGSAQLPPGSAREGVGKVWFRIPEGRTAMTTVVANPDTTAHEIEITVNGTSTRHRVAPGARAPIETPLAGSPTTIALRFRGDRRLIVLETSFR